MLEKISYLIVMLCAALVSADARCAPASVDVTRADILGVKLGMSTARAVATVIDNFKVRRTDIRFETSPRENQVTKTKLPSYFSVDKGGEKLIIYLSAQIPHDPKEPMRVSMIMYEIPWTPDSVQAMKASAIAKFGVPSNGPIAVKSEWCAAPDSNPGYGCSKYPGRDPVLTLSGTTLELSDPRYKQAYIDFMNKVNTTRPSF